MKRSILATVIALGFVGAVGVSIADDGYQQTANLQHVTVTESPGQYETYMVNLDAGFALKALVGNTHKQYMQAVRAAEHSEALRRDGQASSPVVAVAIDNSTGPGMAERIMLLDGSRDTLAIVDAHCKMAMPSTGHRCQLVPQHVAGQVQGERLAAGTLQGVSIASVRLH